MRSARTAKPAIPVPNGYVRGGMGHLTTLMARAAQEHGVEIQINTPVARILVEKWSGDWRRTGDR